MTFAAEKTKRQAGIVVSLPVKIEAHGSANEVWREVSRIESVSRISADFYLTRPFEVGQLLLLKMPIKKDLRRFDLDKEKYCVWGIIRVCEQTLRNNAPSFHVSVAFIGQEPPASFRQNPSTIYKLNKIGENGFWQISELRQGPENRRQSRYTIPIDVVIVVCDADDNIIAQELTVTENISEGGASVFSTLQLNIGDTVKIFRQHGNFSATAIVRNRRTGKDNLPRLHLKFVNANFPLEGIG
jgi:hypothetical protein